MDMIELKNTSTTIKKNKIVLNVLNSRIETREDRIRELEDRSIEFTQSV